MKKIYISQPMRGRATNDIIAERKALIADAAVALQTDDIEVLDTYRGAYTDKHPLRLLAWALEKMAEADAIIFAPDWRDAAAAAWSTWRRRIRNSDDPCKGVIL